MSTTPVQSTPPLGSTSTGVFAAASGYPLRSLEEFAQLLMKHRLIDECAWFDPEGYDGGSTVERLSRAFHEATDNARTEGPPTETSIETNQ